MAEFAKPDTEKYSMAELMAVEMSRNLADDDGCLGGVGAAATIPMAAIRLATLTVAPNINWFCGSSSGMNPQFSELPLTSADPKALVGAEATKRMADIVDMGMTGKWRFGFHGGMQIDKFGNSNMIGIGKPYEQMKVRGPGAVGTPWGGRIEKSYLFTWHHNPRVFVEKVDYICSPGFLNGGESRWEHIDRKSLGPIYIYTPICVFDFDKSSKAVRLKSVHPGYTVEDVVKNTGFDIIIPDAVPQTVAPQPHELFLLRTMVDKTGTLKKVRLTVN